MRILKISAFILAILLAMLCISAMIAYSARVAIVNMATKAHLQSLHASITCFDFHLTSDLTLIVDSMCVESVAANIDIKNTQVKWQMLPNIEVTTIDVENLNIHGQEHMFSLVDLSSSNNQKDASNLNQYLSEDLPAYLKKLGEFKSPFVMKIRAFSYFPFAFLQADNNSAPYSGQVSLLNQAVSFSLVNADDDEFFSTQLSSESGNISGNVQSNLSSLLTFIRHHQLPLPNAQQIILENVSAAGQLSLFLRYQQRGLSSRTHIKNFLINSDSGVENFGAFSLAGAVNFESTLHLTANSLPSLNIDFIEQNNLILEYDNQRLLSILEEKKLSPTLINLVRDNPVTTLSLSPHHDAKLNIEGNNITFTGAQLNAHQQTKSHQASFKNMSIGLPLNKHQLSVEQLNVNSSLILSSIAPYTLEPINITIAGALVKDSNQTRLSLQQGSSISANKVRVLGSQLDDRTKNNIQVSAEHLVTKMVGNVDMNENNSLLIDLNFNSTAQALNLPNTLQLSALNLTGQVKTDLNDINLTTDIKADQVELVTALIEGSIESPEIQLKADNLALSEVLGLNIHLPTPISLVDGYANFSIKGQLVDLSDLAQNRFDADISVRDLSGEIDGIWLQELNWQQEFVFEYGKLNAKPLDTDKTNLTIELIDTPTPISALSASTHVAFDKALSFSARSFSADLLGGSFSIEQLQWPIKKDHSVNVQLTNIDLERIMALDEKQGIVVTGNISGELPVYFDGVKYLIESGRLYNTTSGLIQVKDNPAVTDLKAGNSQLKLAFEALENLHYHELLSAVSMANDGYMQLETAIKGRNPDIDNDVNLNLNLSYDLLGLLESLSITQRFEKDIIKGLQTN